MVWPGFSIGVSNLRHVAGIKRTLAQAWQGISFMIEGEDSGHLSVCLTVWTYIGNLTEAGIRFKPALFLKPHIF